MEKYGFDYFIKRGQAIHEMARPNVFQKGGLNDFNDKVYKPVIQKLKTVGKVPATLVRGKAIQYLVYMLAQKEVQKSGDNVKEFIKRIAGPVEQWNTPGEHPSDQKRDEYVLVQLVKKKAKEALSPQFAQNVLDDTNVATFAKENRIPVTSNFAQGKAKETENVFDMSLEELDHIRALAAPIVKKIRVATGGRGRSIRKLGDKSRFAKKGIDPNSPIGVANILKNAVEELLDSKRDIMGRIQQGSTPNDDESIILYKFPEEEIIKMIQTFQQRIDNGKGIDLDTVYSKIIEPLQNHPNQFVAGFGDLLDLSVESLLDQEPSPGVESDYGSFDADTIHAMLDAGQLTPEELDILKQWIPIASKYKELQQMRQDSKDISGAANKFLQKGEPEESEEGLMGYMSEQVRKDSLYNPKGEFVERGFKKVTNYNHWLSVNE